MLFILELNIYTKKNLLSKCWHTILIIIVIDFVFIRSMNFLLFLLTYCWFIFRNILNKIHQNEQHRYNENSEGTEGLEVER